jgi:hypothetical protein
MMRLLHQRRKMKPFHVSNSPSLAWRKVRMDLKKFREKIWKRFRKLWSTVRSGYIKFRRSFRKHVGNFCAVRRFNRFPEKVPEPVWKAWYRVGLTARAFSVCKSFCV